MQLIFNHPRPSERAVPPSPPELVFDDEPLDHLLYGKGDKGPTSAGIFAEYWNHLTAIRDAHRKGDILVAIDCGAKLVAQDCPLSVGMSVELAAIMTAIVPNIPNPVLQYDLSPVEPLLKRIWQIAVDRRDAFLQKKAGPPFYRWHEHRGNYEEARRILSVLIEICVQERNRLDEAVARNNHAFEYLLEGRFLEAIRGFEAAAKIFEETSHAGDGANSWANWWICRFEAGDVEDIGSAEMELRRLAQVLEQKGFWHLRKPLVLLAGIAEKRGAIQEAIDLVTRAIKACKHSGTRYPETDGQYLARLQALMDQPAMQN
jgi:tetratricopeptide (TPR) repeat protein